MEVGHLDLDLMVTDLARDVIDPVMTLTNKPDKENIIKTRNDVNTVVDTF